MNVMTHADDDPFLTEQAEAIRRLAARTASNIVEIGERLLDVKAKVGHGNWLAWLKREFKWDERTAQRFVAVATVFSNATALSDLKIDATALYLLANQTVKPEARDEAVTLAKTELITVAKAAEIIRKHGRKPKAAIRLRYMPKGRRAKKAARFAEIEKIESRMFPEVSETTKQVRLAVREKIMAGEGIDRKAMGKEFGVGHLTIETAQAWERGRLWGLREAASIEDRAAVIVSVEELKKRLGPIIEVLRREGRKHPAAMITSDVLSAATQLERLIEEWTHHGKIALGGRNASGLLAPPKEEVQ